MDLVELSWPAAAALSKDMPVVFPIAALEQHGHHLPVFTDSLLLGEIIRRAKESVGDKVLFAPLQWLGNSDHHLDFAGTLSAPPRTYLDLLNGLADNFVRHGFRRIVFLNGHGGNDVPGRQAIFELRQRYRERDDLLFLLATYWNLGAKPFDPSLQQSEMGHACEWETSMMLRLAPQLVGDYKTARPVPQGMPFAPAAQGWTTRERTIAGHIGSPHLATAEKGEHLFQTFTQGVAEFLDRVLDYRSNEDQMRFTNEFEGQIAQSENEMKAGVRSRVRRPDAQ
jgi:creatinine amidohydrolase